MTSGGGETLPPVNGGEFLLQLLQNPPNQPDPPQQQQQQPLSSQILSHDPAVAAVGPTLPIPFPQPFQSNSIPSPWPHLHHHRSPPSLAPHNFFLQNPNPNPNPNRNSNPSLNLNFRALSPPGLNQANIQQHNIQISGNLPGDDIRKLGFFGTYSKSSSVHQQEQTDLIFGSLSGIQGSLNDNLSENRLVSQEGKDKLQTSLLKEGREVGFGNTRRLNGLEVEFQHNLVHFHRDSQGNSSTSRDHGQESSGSSGAGSWGKQVNNGHNYRAAVPPPGFAGKQMTQGNREYANSSSSFEQSGEKSRKNFNQSIYESNKGESDRRFLSKKGKNDRGKLDNRRVTDQLDCPGPLPGSKLQSVSASDIDESMVELHGGKNCETGETFGLGMRERMLRDGHKGQSDLDDLDEMLEESVVLEDESGDKSGKKKLYGPRDKDYRSDKRGQSLLGQRKRYLKRQLVCRGDIGRLNAPFLAIYESLIPAEEEKAKQKQLLALLENIVSKEWPDARLYLYGSCANSFGFSKSDIDVCLTIDDADLHKSDILLKLADMLQSDNLQNVQALTRARVPIVKLMDPATGISCDICVNNVLAVVNTKLLRDYADIDVRLRQLAFIVKHWAKSRGVNETYQGTLSSYAYVLMCIHFLQQRRPAILPCLQEMKPTYSVMVDNVECIYFDQVENLVGFGSQNGESIAQLVWAFFNYWAYFHDYANDVISVRTGHILSKRSKDWTRRIGNDRHLICIEDPFEVCHDLGRVVDKYSIKVLREEFERAAEVLQYDLNPCMKLFEPYIPT